MSNILDNDFKYIENSSLPFEKYRNKCFLITGATGLIGSLLIKSLLYCNDHQNLNVRIIAVVRDMYKATSIYQAYINKSSLKFVICDLKYDKITVQGDIDYIIHCAAMTTSKDMISNPVECLQIAENGTNTVLELAKQKKVASVVYLSSMEVYGQLNVKNHLIDEKELGNIDLSSIRSCYPEGKRFCECLCHAYAHQYGINVIIARLAQTFGAGILKNEGRVFAQFAKSILENKDLVLKTEGLSEGNYVYSADAVIGILLLLTEGKSGEAYNIVNEECHTTIKHMAELVIENFGNQKQKIVYDIPDKKSISEYAPDVKMHLSSKKINCLGWHANIGLLEAYDRMIKYMQEEF